MKKINLFISTNRITISRWLVILGLIIISWFLCRGYYFDNFINPSQKISLDNASKFGDFIGGVIGAIFTLVGIVLLYETLSFQRKELRESRQVFESQQFENSFFNLLSLYQNIIESTHYEDFVGQSHNGQDFFVEKKKDCFVAFNSTKSVFRNRKIAIDVYTNYYTENKEQIAHYFRTLYRIFKTIESSKFDESKKMFYAKIVRAQLTESELFFINYNACTEYGKNFRKLIVKYNIVKHLPLFEKLEFTEWRVKLNQDKINSLNTVFSGIIDFFKNDVSNDDYYKTFLKGKYAIKGKNQETKMSLKIFKNNKVKPSPHLQSGYGLDDFSDTELEKLLKAFFVETLKNGNYEIIKQNKNIEIKTDIENKENGKSEIWVEAINNKTIKLK
ncbi:putative phage abortive infection protein [Tenacibaculum dicentrarchi]|nr:putative phage abortive infection protein [Tenacibaculum dicentrarchi]